MSMPTIADLKKEAESLGLTGSDVATYVIKQQEIFREDRAKLRDHEREMREQQERQKDREHELELARLRATNPSSEEPLTEAVSRPKLPVYKDGEDICAFFVRFERTAELLQIRKETYAVRIGTLLSG